jgi:glutamyl-Q tRNA(Asp) synthetase
MSAPVFRFAPSPTGHLHLGHALSALTQFRKRLSALADAFCCGSKISILTRCKPEFEESIYEDLEWLGMELGNPR